MKQLLKMKLGILANVMILLTIAINAWGQPSPSTHTKKSPTEDVDLYFWEYLPPDYSPSTPDGYPLIIFLHGYDERANPGADPMTELDDVLDHGPPKEINEGEEMCFRVKGIEKCFIVLSPQLVEPDIYWTQHPSDLIEYAINELNVDLTRIYVTGLSMGGIGTLRLAQGTWLHSSDAAAVAVAPGGSANISNACVFAVRDIPLWAVHSANDQKPGTEWADMNNLTNAINGCSNPVPTPEAHLTTIPGSAHDVWSNFYKTDHTSYFPNVYEWFLLNPKGASNTHPMVPGVDAGTNQSISISTVDLNGTAGDNASGPPAESGNIDSYQWTKQSGPSSFNIQNPNAASTAVTNLVTGTYVFRLTVTEDTNTQYDEVKVTVDASGGSEQLTWHSYNTTMQSNPSQQGVINSTDLSTLASVEFYQSTNDFGVDKLNLFSTYTNGNHGNTNSHATKYWANGSGDVYPFAGISTVGRNSDTGEGNAPQPFGVNDLQLHPPNSDKLTVAAFIVPVTGNYTVSNLAARRVSANTGTVRFKVFDQNKAEIKNIQATNNQDWVVQATPISLGVLNEGDRIYFATDRDAAFNSDFTEVTWSVTYDPVLSQSWNSYDITMQSNPSQQGVVNSDLSTPASVEFYESTNDFGVNKLNLFSTYTNSNHSNPDSHATKYWANSSGHAYPFAGISTVGRNSDTGEGNAPQPFGVLDLQLHPPNSDKLTVAAFIVPVTGNYTVSDLAARRVSANAGTIGFKVFDQNKTLKTTIHATNNQDWVVQATPISLGVLTEGDRIYFATDREGAFNSDFTEVSWTVTLSESGEGLGANMASANSAESKANISESKEKSLELYPNPVENNINLKGLGSEADVKIYDSQRTLLFDRRLISTNGSTDLETRSLRPGTYYLVLQTDNQLYRFRFIKE